MDDRVNSEITEFVERTGRRPEEWQPDWEASYNIKPTNDIPVLIDFFLKKHTRNTSRLVRGLTPETKKLMLDYSWPGNVRQLRNIIERTIILAPGDRVACSGLDGPAARQGCLALIAVVSGSHHAATGDRHGGGHGARRFRPHDRDE